MDVKAALTAFSGHSVTMYSEGKERKRNESQDGKISAVLKNFMTPRTNTMKIDSVLDMKVSLATRRD